MAEALKESTAEIIIIPIRGERCLPHRPVCALKGHHHQIQAGRAGPFCLEKQGAGTPGREEALLLGLAIILTFHGRSGFFE